MSPSQPDFYLRNPVARSFVIGDRFNAPRNYWFAPDKLQLHEGIDLVAVDAQGRPVAILAAQRGIVDKVDFSAQGYGNYVRIVHPWHDGTWVTWYGHMSSIAVTAGQTVRTGQKLGIAGTTGYSSCIHLHLTLQHIGHGLKNYVVDDVVDPEPYFKLGPVPPFDEAWYVADITIEDGTVMQPGQRFRKVWRIRNSGTTTWTRGYRLAFAGDNRMGAPSVVALPTLPVEPGQLVDVAVDLTAPARLGTHRSTWQIRNADRELFNSPFYAEIEVEEEPSFSEASYVADVTIPDGAVIQPGQQFLKTWRVRNTGTTTWDRQYSLRFAGDDRMDGPASVSLKGPIAPGDITDVSVMLTAPATAGRHRSTWKLHDANGDAFEYGVYAEIQVPEKPSPPDRLNEARYVADVTIPDGTRMRPGRRFKKTWRIRNSGTTTWGEGCTLAFFHNKQMGGPASVPLPHAEPGDVVDVSVTLIAPTQPGQHKSTWKPRDPQGKFFEFEVFALIKVIDDAKPDQVDELSWVADISIEDGTAMRPGESFIKTWRVRNTGTTTWGSGYSLAFADDEQMGGPDSIALPDTGPGETADISMALKAPTQPGLHKSTWKPRDPQGDLFDYHVFTLIEVIDPDRTYNMLDYLRGDGRLYEMEHTWNSGGRMRAQTQIDGERFYHVLDSEWSELWDDEYFIYRGTDTSAGEEEAYTLTESGHYGSAWIPRRMTIGVPFRHMALIVSRRTSDGEITRQHTQITWLQLEAVHNRIRLPGGFQLNDVAVLAAYRDKNGQPQDRPFERYFYAKKYGLVAWGSAQGRAYIVEEYESGAQPDNQRKRLDWL
ncbi:MAG: peptidoglycan DD-metalloendopeptidase family protein [Anaerolineae bacterium]|nr:peptidoglycan DD-metalloendopeptidase family protein [Anaerolineae bacterium]